MSRTCLEHVKQSDHDYIGFIDEMDRQMPDQNSNELFSIEMKQEIGQFFEELLGYFWTYLAGVIGDTTTMIIFQSAIRDATTTYSFFEYAQVSEAGIKLMLPSADIDAIEWDHLRDGLLAMLENCLSLVTELTGNILVSKLEPMVAEFKSKVIISS